MFLSCLATLAAAQTAIFNIPSTDTQDAKKLYLEGDFYSHVAAYADGGFHSYSPVVIYGLTERFEVGANLLYERGEGDATLEFQPNAKFRFCDSDRCGVDAAVGTIAYVPLNKATGDRTPVLLYANVSKTIKAANNLRLTVGGYSMANAGPDFGARRGITLGFEQPVNDKLTLVADWSSGNNRFGYVTAGANLTLSDRQFAGFGYSFGNTGRGNNYLTAFYGFQF